MENVCGGSGEKDSALARYLAARAIIKGLAYKKSDAMKYEDTEALGGY